MPRRHRQSDRQRDCRAVPGPEALEPRHLLAGVELVQNGSFESPVNATFGPAADHWQEAPPGAPFPSVVNYPWLASPGIWNLTGPNPEGNQIGVLAGNAAQTVGTLQADKLYTFSYSVYFRSAQPFEGDLTSNLWSGDILGTNLPSPLPINQWIDVSATINTSLPTYASLIDRPLKVHFYSTGAYNEILLDGVSLMMEDAPPPAPVTYYVSSSTGNDASDGLSPGTAWASFSPFVPMTLGPATTVQLRRGDAWPNSQLVLAGKGTATAPIRLTAYGEGAPPLITGINVTDKAAVVINNGSNWVIDSLNLRQAKVGLYLRYTGGNTDGTGAMFNNTNITVSNMHFQDMNHPWNNPDGSITVQPPYELSWGAGIWVGGNIPSPPGGPWASVSTTVLDGLTVRHSSFQNVQTGVGTGWYFPPAYKRRLLNVTLEDSWVTGAANGAFAFFNTSGFQVRRWDTWLGGTMFFSGGTTAAFLQDMDNVLIENSEFAYNKRNQTGNDGVGIDFEGNVSNSVFQHNVIHNNDGAGILILPTNGNNTGLQMTSNTLWNNARNPLDSGQNKEAIASNNSHSGQFANNGVYLGTDTNSGLAVYNNQTRWNNLFRANLGNNRTATSWAAVSGRPVVWDFTTGVAGWGNAQGWSGFGESGGRLVGTSSGTDPNVESAPTWVNTRERRWVLVRMSQTQGDSGQLSFQTETDATWTPAKSVTFPIIADGVMRTYVVDMGQSAEYRGVVTRWRLAPTNAAGSAIAIEDFESRIDPYLQAAAAIDTNVVDVAFNMAMLPGGGVLDPANFTLSGPGRGTLAANPDSVSQIATAAGPVFRLKWNTGVATGAPATVTVTNAQNARGYGIGTGPGVNSATFSTIPVDIVVDTPASSTQTQAQAGHPLLTAQNATTVTKRGGGTLVLDGANTYVGGTRVEAGHVIVRNLSALGSGPLEVLPGARVTFEVGVGRVNLANLVVHQGARIDVGHGGLVLPAGTMSAAAVRALLISGRNGGSWDGPGISTSNAPAGSQRAVGYTVRPDGSIVVAYAAPGDGNLDGVFDILDLSEILSAGKFDTGSPANWTQGDTNYDNVFDIVDLADILGSGTYGQGSYLHVIATVFATGPQAEPEASSLSIASAAAAAAEPAAAVMVATDESSPGDGAALAPRQEAALVSEPAPFATSSGGEAAAAPPRLARYAAVPLARRTAARFERPGDARLLAWATLAEGTKAARDGLSSPIDSTRPGGRRRGP